MSLFGRIFLNVVYLQQLVAGQEVCGRLENGRHGFSQLLVNCFHVGGGKRLWLKHKLTVWREKNVRFYQFNL